jgi:hypothetical protein
MGELAAKLAALEQKVKGLEVMLLTVVEQVALLDRQQRGSFRENIVKKGEADEV